MIEWFRWWYMNTEDAKSKSISANAVLVADIAHQIAERKRSSYPNWGHVEKLSGISADDFIKAFEELEHLGIIFSGFPSILIALADTWRFPPMFGSISIARPSAEVWKKIRTEIFKRDNYTCAYCGTRGVRLECDHIVPASKGGGHEPSNLTTACFNCNRSKRSKLVSEWRRG